MCFRCAQPVQDVQVWQAEGSRHQRERLRDQVQVRQPVWVQRVSGRWYQACHRCYVGRKGMTAFVFLKHFIIFNR